MRKILAVFILISLMMVLVSHPWIRSKYLYYSSYFYTFDGFNNPSEENFAELEGLEGLEGYHKLIQILRLSMTFNPSQVDAMVVSGYAVEQILQIEISNNPNDLFYDIDDRVLVKARGWSSVQRTKDQLTQIIEFRKRRRLVVDPTTF